MPGPERRLIGEHLQRRLTSCFEQPTETVLPRPLESTVERFNGRIQREVLGLTVSSHRDLDTLLRGFNQAYNGRRQRVLKGRSPERVVSERLGALPARANPSHDPPFDPCSLPKALQVITRAKDVSHPDTRGGDQRSCERDEGANNRGGEYSPGPLFACCECIGEFTR